MIHYSEPVIHWYPQLTPTGLYPIPQSLHRYQYLTASQHWRNKRRVIAGELGLTRCFEALLRHPVSKQRCLFGNIGFSAELGEPQRSYLLRRDRAQSYTRIRRLGQGLQGVL